jgi:Flp pilus assembly protein TadG
MKRVHPFQRLIRDEKGVTLVEFAFVAPVMLLMLMGLGDLCYREYVTAVLQGAVQKAARDSSLESGTTSATVIDNKVQVMVQKVAADATFVTTRKSFKSFKHINELEDFSDANANGAYDPGECFEDENHSNVRDVIGGNTGNGGANDVMVYTVAASYPRVFPMAGMLGWSNYQTVSASTAIRNQPYANQTVPPVICGP